MVRAAMLRQDGDGDYERTYRTALRAERRVHHFATVDGGGPALVARSGRDTQLAAIHSHVQQNGDLTARAQLELRRGKRRLPAGIQPALGGEVSELHGDVALTSSVIFEGDRNPPYFTATRVLDDISAANTARASAVILLATASMFVMFVMRGRAGGTLAAHHAREGGDDRLHTRSRVAIEIGIPSLHVGHVVRVIHHSHAIGVVAIAVKYFGSAALAPTAVMPMLMLSSLHMPLSF
jgi:hypothetical protein